MQRLQGRAKVGPPRRSILVYRMHPSTLDVVAAALFAAALLHTFAAKRLHLLARRFPGHEGLFHLLGEVEVIFGFWALVLIATMAVAFGPGRAIEYAESRNFTVKATATVGDVTRTTTTVVNVFGADEVFYYYAVR